MRLNTTIPLLCFFALITGGCIHSGGAANGGVAKIKYVTIKYINDLDFKTIGEYFGEKKEHQYFRCIARDGDTGRSGTYFIVGLDRSVKRLPAEVSAKISLITSLKDGVDTFICKIPEHNRYPFTSEIYCGIVSKPVDGKKIKAWNVEFIDGNGNVLFSKHSYMWTP